MYYRDANGMEHESYSAACEYYGADTPEQVEAEMREREQEEIAEYLDDLEAYGSPENLPYREFHFNVGIDDAIPF